MISAVFLLLAGWAAGCSAQTEEQALATLRQMTRSGIAPGEDLVASIESRFAGKRAGALAKLLRAKMRYDRRDFAGSASILKSTEFQQRTKVADHALYLRGLALQQIGNHAEAIGAFERITVEYPESIRVNEAKLAWADSAIASGHAKIVLALLNELSEHRDAGALLLTAKAYEAQGNQLEAVRFYRRAYFFGAGSGAAKEAETKLTSLGQALAPQTADEAVARADKLFAAKDYAAAEKAYADVIVNFPTFSTPALSLKRLTTFANLKKAGDVQAAFNVIPLSAAEKEEAYYQVALANARARLWPQARQAVEEMRQKYPNGKFTAKAWVDAGMAARDAKNKLEEQYFLRAAVASFPQAIEVAGAQFELAWLEHEAHNFAKSSQMLIEHLARYAEKDTSNRGKAGYWAARDSERAGRLPEACALYEGESYRYSANWYGYLAQQRLGSLKSQGKCSSALPAGSLVPQAVAALRTVTVAAETSTTKELARAEKSEDLSVVGLFDWAIEELEEAKKTAQNSPKINLVLAQHYRLRGDNVSALLALAKSYPDYSQMFPEEMGREEWDIFYPLTNWNEIKYWAAQRNLDKYQVAGLIRQESVFNPRARSHANAHGLMQLLVPTARSMARKYVSKTSSITPTTLYDPPVNIELGTAYMRDQFDKFGRIEYVAVAYNAGPGRVAPWRASLPAEIDEFVEAIPFRETKGYVQGVIRNSAQYRRLYDENGNFKPNVGTKPLRGEIDSKTREQLAAEFPEIVIDSTASVE